MRFLCLWLSPHRRKSASAKARTGTDAHRRKNRFLCKEPRQQSCSVAAGAIFLVSWASVSALCCRSRRRRGFSEQKHHLASVLPCHYLLVPQHARQRVECYCALAALPSRPQRHVVARHGATTGQSQLRAPRTATF
jgi:hypothetical protein